ncbi:hypothetical protein ACLB2K_014336 [Fragaria x ananassa]
MWRALSNALSSMWCSLGYSPDRGRISHLEEWLLEIHKNTVYSKTHFFVGSSSCKCGKINFDGAWKGVKPQQWIGSYYSPSYGCVYYRASLFRSHNSAVEAEAEVLLCGVKMAMLLKLEHIFVEGDCQEVIKALNESLASPCWRISSILKKVAHLVSLFRRIHWNWFHEKLTALQMRSG